MALAAALEPLFALQSLDLRFRQLKGSWNDGSGAAWQHGQGVRLGQGVTRETLSACLFGRSNPLGPECVGAVVAALAQLRSIGLL